MIVEFHCHTFYSSDSLSRPEDILRVARQKGIDRLVITDHNSIQGALRTRDLDPERVIVGEEIMTQDGELLASFVTQSVPAGLPPLDAIARLREQGAFISVSHPFDKTRSGHWSAAGLAQIGPLVDAIEIFNARCVWPGYNIQALAYAQAHDLPGTAGSDAHHALEVGLATLAVPAFNTADELRAVIRKGKRMGHATPPWLRFSATYAKILRRSGIWKPKD